MIKLTIVEEGSTKQLNVTLDVVTIGRAGENLIKLNEKKASRKHAKLEMTPEGLVFTDLGSSNGTKINGTPATTAVLKAGDRIIIGEAVIHIVEVPATVAPASVPVMPEPVGVTTKDPVPDADKAEVRKKIEDRRSALDRAKVATPPWVKWATAAAILVGLGVIALLANNFLSREQKTPATPNTVAGKARPEANLETGQAKLAAFRAKVDAAPRVTQAHLDDLTQLGIEYRAVFAAARKSSNKDGMETDPISDLGTTLRERRAQEVAAAYLQDSTQVLDALNGKKYADAVAALVKLQGDVGDALPGVVADLKSRVDTTVREDYDGVKAFSDGLQKNECLDEAQRHLTKNAPRFVGTEFEAKMTSRAENLARLASAKAAEPVRAPKEDEMPAVAAKPATPEDRATPETPGAPKNPATPAKPKEAAAPATSTPALTALAARIAENAPKSGLIGMKFDFDGKKGEITQVDQNCVSVKLGEAPENTMWGAVPAKTLLAIAAASKLEAEDKLLVAEVCYANGLKDEGARTLYEYRGDKGTKEFKERKPKVDALLAKVRGDKSAPEEGYLYDGKAGWETHGEMVNRKALAEAEKLDKEIASDSSSKELDKDFKTVMAILNNPDVTEANRTIVHDKTVKALGEYKTRAIKGIKQNANKGALQNLMAVKKELDKARAEALKVIYDHTIYPDENHGIVGQPKVDEKVKDVHKWWDGKAEGVISVDVQRGLDNVRRVNEQYLAQLGETPSAEELKEFDDIVNNITGRAQIGIREVAASGSEREMYGYNDRVSKFNTTVFKLPNGVNHSSIDQAEVNNTYREMMGRRKLLMDPKLCLAAQKHTEKMQGAGSIWHEGPDGSPGSRCQAEGFSGPVGENCAMGYEGPQAVFNGWYNSSGHHRNMLSDSWNLIGVGNAGNFWTQDFGMGSAPPEFAGMK